MENKEQGYYLTIKGQRVYVSEEVYRAYVQPVRAEQRRKRREWRCKKVSENGGYYVRCKERCEECPYYLAGNSALGNVTSLDKLVDCEVEIEDIDSDLESKYIEQETKEEESARLREAIATLNDRQQEMVRMIYFEGKTQEEVAKRFAVGKQAISNAMQRIYAQLEKKLKN